MHRGVDRFIKEKMYRSTHIAKISTILSSILAWLFTKNSFTFSIIIFINILNLILQLKIVRNLLSSTKQILFFHLDIFESFIISYIMSNSLWTFLFYSSQEFAITIYN